MRFGIAYLLVSSLCSLLALPACSSPTALPTQEMEVRADNVTLHARIVGSAEAGNVLIAVNMGPGVSGHYMASLEQLASDEFAVVTYDQRGTGRSTKPSDGYALLKYVADLEAVRRAAGAERVHLLGHCWGGLVAMRYATVHPQRVRSMVLIGSAPPSWQSVVAGQVNKAQRIAELQRRGIIPDTISTLEDILPAYLSDPGFALPAEFKNLQYSPSVERETMSALGEYDITPEVANLDGPVLIMWGQDDPFGLPTAEATATALASAQVEFVVLEKCGHLWHECPDEFFSQVSTFLERHPR